MKIRIDGRYMLLPVSEHACKKKLILRDDAGKICVELDTRLSANSDFVLPYDMRDYIGKVMELNLEPEADFAPDFADETDDALLYAETWRPLAHFTSARGWINDPNGFVFYEGWYHLFFQHNPADTCWGNMHWGHAVSRDLCHWTQCEEALFPDETGTMFSGSAVVDDKNLTGLQENDHAPLLLYYTAAGNTNLMSREAGYTQRMAYSVDGGKTFKKYPGARVKEFAPGNRDPKIIWCEEIGCYVMAIYLCGSEFMLLHSDNLLDWTPVQRITLEGENECPDFYPLECEGRRYWVLMGAHDRYIVGHIEGRLFVPDQTIRPLHSGKSYAAQSCFGLADGRRVRFGWNRSGVSGVPFNCSMTTPQEMTLKKIDGALCLCAYPCAEFEVLRGEGVTGRDEVRLPGRAHDIVMTIPTDGRREIALFGLTMTLKNGRLSCQDSAISVSGRDGQAALRIVQDVHAVEVYAGQGESTMLIAHLSDALLKYVSCPGAEITVWPIDSIWQERAEG